MEKQLSEKNKIYKLILQISLCLSAILLYPLLLNLLNFYGLIGHKIFKFNTLFSCLILIFTIIISIIKTNIITKKNIISYFLLLFILISLFFYSKFNYFPGSLNEIYTFPKLHIENYSFSILYLSTIPLFLNLIYSIFNYLNPEKSSNKIKYNLEKIMESDYIDKHGLKRIPFIKTLSDFIVERKETTPLTIGITSDWGEGKTFFIDYVSLLIDQNNINNNNNIIQIAFDPWTIDKDSNLYKKFLNVILNKLSNPYLSILLYSYLETVVSLKFSFYDLKYSISNLVFSKGSSDLKKLINNEIKSMNKKVVIYIDNIDRLEKDEIVELSKLTRDVFEFDNFIYILCYSRAYVSALLNNQEDENKVRIEGTINNSNQFTKRKNEYFDKIVNMEIRLPVVKPDQIVEVFIIKTINKFNSFRFETIVDHEDIDKINFIRNVNAELVHYTIHNIRDAENFLNFLLFRFLILINKEKKILAKNFTNFLNFNLVLFHSQELEDSLIRKIFEYLNQRQNKSEPITKYINDLTEKYRIPESIFNSDFFSEILERPKTFLLASGYNIPDKKDIIFLLEDDSISEKSIINELQIYNILETMGELNGLLLDLFTYGSSLKRIKLKNIITILNFIKEKENVEQDSSGVYFILITAIFKNSYKLDTDSIYFEDFLKNLYENKKYNLSSSDFKRIITSSSNTMFIHSNIPELNRSSKSVIIDKKDFDNIRIDQLKSASWITRSHELTLKECTGLPNSNNNFDRAYFYFVRLFYSPFEGSEYSEINIYLNADDIIQYEIATTANVGFDPNSYSFGSFDHHNFSKEYPYIENFKNIPRIEVDKNKIKRGYNLLILKVINKAISEGVFSDGRYNYRSPDQKEVNRIIEGNPYSFMYCLEMIKTQPKEPSEV